MKRPAGRHSRILNALLPAYRTDGLKKINCANREL